MNKMVLTVGATLTAFAAFAAEKLPTDYPANDIDSGSVEGLTWTGAARAYKIENDVVLVFTNTTAGNCSFDIAVGYRANGRYLLVGGGGPGGEDRQCLCGAGGGAGGFLTASEIEFKAGAYAVTVGAGSAPDGYEEVRGATGWNANGLPSSLVGGMLSVTALGGGGGGIANGKFDWKYACGNPYPYCTSDDDKNYDFSKVDVACGGGGAAIPYGGQHGGKVKGDQGCNGGDGQGLNSTAGGGGGAGEAGTSGSSGGKGGDGKMSDITGEEVWYAGGGAGGSWKEWGGLTIDGGKGGGGAAVMDGYNTPVSAKSGNGTDTLGGGGAGTCYAKGNGPNAWSYAGRGGNGVVVVRLTLPKLDVIEGLSFKGATEVFNIGEGDTMETVLVFKDAENDGSFTLDGDADVRVLLVGGGGAGSFEGAGAGNLVGAGGGAGGFVEADDVELGIGTYSVTVGKGGEPAGNKDTRNSNPNGSGTDSTLTGSKGELYRAIGGGAGGISNGNNDRAVASGKDGGSGGGAGGTLDRQSATTGSSLQNQGNAGGKGGYINAAGGGGGAGDSGAPSAGDGQSGAGGVGKPSDITGEEDVWYAGGGAGGVWTNKKGDWTVAGGKGGGGKSFIHVGNTSDDVVLTAYDGEDGTGGGGAGAAGIDGAYGLKVGSTAGRGGNGIVIVRVKKIYPNEPLPGVSFTGAAKWYNLGGHGKTRETVVVYTNVNEVGTLTLARRATARVLLVGGGGAGGYEGAGNLVGAGGGAGGFVEKTDVALKKGEYSIVVGKGGEPKGNKDWDTNENPNNNGTDSTLTGSQGELYCAIGGGAGGIANGNWRGSLATGRAGGSGGGSATMNGYAQSRGLGTEGQGNAGGRSLDNSYRAAGGGGGAGAQATDASSSVTSSAGGDGKLSDITGEDVWYAGGGAGGAWKNDFGDRTIAGGNGGGGKSFIHVGNTPDDVQYVSYAGEDGKGGGGAGSAGIEGAHGLNVGSSAGRGGNGIVIVRITEVAPVGMTVIIH